LFKPKTLRRRALSLCTSLAVAMGFGLIAAHPAAAFAPSGIENFNPNWDSTLTDGGLEPSALVLSDKFDGIDQFSHLTLVAGTNAVQAAWYLCPPGTYGVPGKSVSAVFPPSASCLAIGTDTQGTTPVAPGVGVDTAFELFYDIPVTEDGVARDLVSFACDAVIAAGHCTGQAETGVILDDAATSTNSSSGELLDWCVDTNNDGTCDTARHPAGHGSAVPAVVPFGPFPVGSTLLVRARFSADVGGAPDDATLCIDFHADAFDPPNNCDSPGGESFDATTQAAPAYSTATFTVPTGSFPVNAEMGWYLFEDDDNSNGGEADNADGYCHSGSPVPVGAVDPLTGLPALDDTGEGRTCLLDSHYIVAAVPTAAQVHVTNDDQAPFDPTNINGTFGPNPGDDTVGGQCENANRAKSDLVLTGAEDDVIGCVFDQFAELDTAGNKDIADALAHESVTFELTGPGHIDSCEGLTGKVEAGGTSCHLESASTLDGVGNGSVKYEMDWHATAIPGGGPTAAVTITFCEDPEDNGCADAGVLQDTLNKTVAAGINHVHLRKTRNLTFNPNCHVGPVSITRRAGTRVSLTACLHDIFHNFSSLDAPVIWRLDTSGVFSGAADPARFIGQPDQCFGDDCDFNIFSLFDAAGDFDGTGKAVAVVTAKPRAAGHLTRVFACLDLDLNGECDALQPDFIVHVIEILGLDLTNTEALMEIHWK
jgi:hypothetical protein